MNYALASLAIPFTVALLTLLLQRRSEANPIVPAITVLATAVSLVFAGLALETQAVSGAVSHLNVGGWDSPLAIRLRLTPLKALLLGFVALIHLLTGLYAWRAKPKIARDYWPLSALLHTSLAALILSADIFNLYVTLELLSLSAVALVCLSGPKAYTPALYYLLLSLGASLCYLMGVAVIYGQYGVLDMTVLAGIMEADHSTRFALLLMTAGLMLKGALWPLHLWLPEAHTYAPTPVSALLSGLVVKGPLFILWQLWNNLAPEALAREMGPLFAAGGVVALVSGGWSAFRAPFIKTLVAYSTVAQLGYALMGLGLLLFLQERIYAVALWLFVLAHGLAKVSMFLAAGEMQTLLGSKRVTAMRGATQTIPITMSAFAIAGISLIGMPPTGGFLAKWSLLEPLFTQANHWPWASGVLLGTFVSAAYVFRAIALGFYQAPMSREPRHFDRVSQWLALLPALLVGLMAFAGQDLIAWMAGVTQT
ncbi:NADH-quinone oxidoreductase subunit J [Proteobacteria bacterium 005FR1]|nr:NADH-quinone oxidoreductase subunit J [Proteobacteria bacterium 005FR1]